MNKDAPGRHRHRSKRNQHLETQDLPITEIAHEARSESEWDSPYSLLARLDDDGNGVELMWRTTWKVIIYGIMIFFGFALILTAGIMALVLAVWTR